MRTFTKFEKGKVFTLKNFKKKMLNPAMMEEKKTNLYYFSQGREKRINFPFGLDFCGCHNLLLQLKRATKALRKKRKKKKEKAHQEFNTPTGN